MGRPAGARNKPKETTTMNPDQTADDNRAMIEQRNAPASKGEVAIFQPARLPYHPAIEERFGLDKGTWKVLVEAIFPAAKSVDSIVMALSYCKSRGLDIMKRPVHIVPVYDSARGGYVESIWPGISELRTTASRTHGYAGCDEAEFGEIIEGKFSGRVKDRGEWKDVTITVDYPAWCRITVYRIIGGQRCKFVGPKVIWLESYATMGASDIPNKMWQERPEGQLEKCAEAAALRRAFPEEIGNELTAEEMIGRNVHDLSVDIPAVTDAATTPNKDAGPPRAIAAPKQEAPEDPEQVRDGTPPKREPKPAEKEDPISSGPPRQIDKIGSGSMSDPVGTPLRKDGFKDTPKPHRIPGEGHTYESWAEKYCDLIRTSPDIATVYEWIDSNSKEFSPTEGAPKQAGPLTRLTKGKPSVAATVKKATEQTMEALRDAAAKAEKTAAKAAKKPAATAPSDMADDAAGVSDPPMNPEDILALIDQELAAVEDPDTLQDVWDTACDPLVAKLEFPPDQDAAQAIYNKHEKRLGGD